MNLYRSIKLCGLFLSLLCLTTIFFSCESKNEDNQRIEERIKEFYNKSLIGLIAVDLEVLTEQIILEETKSVISNRVFYLDKKLVQIDSRSRVLYRDTTLSYSISLSLDLSKKDTISIVHFNIVENNDLNKMLE